jgi:S-adenosylmethionine:diacylglycerol 3-amino-3-carboxypropyl transferase
MTTLFIQMLKIMSFSKLTHVLCRKNFVKVLVYFEDLNYELIVEEPEIEVNTIILESSCFLIS